MSDHKYTNILHHPRHRSSVHPPMSQRDRAAQFAPFSALSGHIEGAEETARITQPRIDLSEDAIAQLNRQLRLVLAHLTESPLLSITHFVPDLHKSGGAYVVDAGHIKKYDPHRHMFTLSTGTEILIEDILSLEGELLEELVPQCQPPYLV